MNSLDGLRFIDRFQVAHGSRWIYSAGFNTSRNLSSTERIDEEIDDIRLILANGGSVALLSHQGSYKDGSAADIDYLIPYLSRKLETDVRYHRELLGQSAIDTAHQLLPGRLCLFGNTRQYADEEDYVQLSQGASFSKALSCLGHQAVIGGFSKAHRRNASNVGLCEWMPCWCANSIKRELESLEPWRNHSDKYGVVVLGGVKREKIVTGLLGIGPRHDMVIPAGVVLNSLLHLMKVDVGDSVLADEGVQRLLEPFLDSETFQKVVLPDALIARPANSRSCPSRSDKNSMAQATTFNTFGGIPKGYEIVDFVLNPIAVNKICSFPAGQCQLLVAGTPSLVAEGFTTATEQVAMLLEHHRPFSLVLGGDSAAEIPFSGLKSSGGGSSLEYLAGKPLPVLEALRENLGRFPMLNQMLGAM